MSNIPFDVWLNIDAYRDFHDVPHLMLVSDGSGRRWVLDNRFDDAADDYAGQVGLFEAASDAHNDALLDAVVARNREPAQLLPMSALSFDPTRRKSVMITERK